MMPQTIEFESGVLWNEDYAKEIRVEFDVEAHPVVIADTPMGQNMGTEYRLVAITGVHSSMGEDLWPLYLSNMEFKMEIDSQIEDHIEGIL